ncbi:hypothetical protein BH18ACT4_BH18ACT4_10660 [soil metagenome]
MDLTKLKTSDWIILGSALVLLIASFLPWFEVTASVEDFGSSSASGNGWDVGFFWAGLPVLLGLAMAAYVAIKAFSQTQLPDAPWPVILLAAGALAALIVILTLLIGEDAGEAEIGDVFNSGVDIDVKRAFGLFLATLASIGLAAGAFLKFQEDKAGGSAGYRAPGSTPPTPF